MTRNKLDERIERIEKRLADIERRLDKLEKRTAGDVFINGPQIESDAVEKIIKELIKDADKMVKKGKEANMIRFAEVE